MFALHVDDVVRTGLREPSVLFAPGDAADPYPTVGAFRIELDDPNPVLEIGDRVLRIGSVDARGLGFIRAHAVANGEADERGVVEVRVERDGNQRTLPIQLTGPPLPWNRIPASILFVATAVIVLLRGSPASRPRLFFVAVMTMLLFQTPFPSASATRTLVYLVLFNALGGLALALVGLWCSRFPEELRREDHLSWGWAAAFGVAWYAVRIAYVAGGPAFETLPIAAGAVDAAWIAFLLFGVRAELRPGRGHRPPSHALDRARLRVRHRADRAALDRTGLRARCHVVPDRAGHRRCDARDPAARDPRRDRVQRRLRRRSAALADHGGGVVRGRLRGLPRQRAPRRRRSARLRIGARSGSHATRDGRRRDRRSRCDRVAGPSPVRRLAVPRAPRDAARRGTADRSPPRSHGAGRRSPARRRSVRRRRRRAELRAPRPRAGGLRDPPPIRRSRRARTPHRRRAPRANRSDRTRPDPRPPARVSCNGRCTGGSRRIRAGRLGSRRPPVVRRGTRRVRRTRIAALRRRVHGQ